MRRLVSILLFLAMAAFSSSLPQAFHELEHEREDQAEALADRENSSSQPVPHHHSEDDCPICRQLHIPMTSFTPHIWLVDAGDWVPFLSMLPVSQRSQTFPARISCRGPPALCGC